LQALGLLTQLIDDLGCKLAMASVLVVDDNAEVRQALRELLEWHGYDVTEAGDGDEALWLLVGNASSEPTLIILDLEMPTMTGWEFIDILRSYHRLSAIPVLVASGNEWASLQQTAALLGYLRKPYSPEISSPKSRKLA
jgi:two-component system, chemotaxis family, chemotaxis protein CheY